MSSTQRLREYYASLHREATRLAGWLNDLSQRAAVYHHVFEHSGRNHIFPLIAAHGALWARGYFRFGMKLGRLLSWQYAFSPGMRRRQLASLERFADAFRDVNRRVCIDTYVTYHFTARFGEHPDAEQLVRPHLLEPLNRLHAARGQRRELSDAEKREVFLAHFLDEQETVVGPALTAAGKDLAWPLVKSIALKPRIGFAYFPPRRALWFRNFADTQERIEKGLHAFDLAAQAGWDHVESQLRAYEILPEEFFASSVDYFSHLRNAILATA